MTQTSAIITDAYRESNLIRAGAVPSDTQNTEGLQRLQSMIAGVYGYDVGERLYDWQIGQSHVADPDVSWDALTWAYPIANSRLLLDHAGPQTIYFPENPENGARIRVVDTFGLLSTYNVVLDGNGRLIDGQPTATLSTDNLKQTWVYSDDHADWRAVENLALDAEMPFPEEFDDYFILKLAGRLNPRYGRSLSDAALARLQEVTEQLNARYRQTRTVGAPTALQRLAGPNDRGFQFGRRSGRNGWMG